MSNSGGKLRTRMLLWSGLNQRGSGARVPIAAGAAVHSGSSCALREQLGGHQGAAAAAAAGGARCLMAACGRLLLLLCALMAWDADSDKPAPGVRGIAVASERASEQPSDFAAPRAERSKQCSTSVFRHAMQQASSSVRAVRACRVCVRVRLRACVRPGPCALRCQLVCRHTLACSLCSGTLSQPSESVAAAVRRPASARCATPPLALPFFPLPTTPLPACCSPAAEHGPAH